MKTYCILGLLLMSSSVLFSQYRDFYPPSAVPDRIMLNLTEEPSTTMAVTWRTAIYIDSGCVQIALADPSPNLQDQARTLLAEQSAYLSDQNGANYHSVVIDDLQPGTLYASSFTRETYSLV